MGKKSSSARRREEAALDYTESPSTSREEVHRLSVVSNPDAALEDIARTIKNVLDAAGTAIALEYNGTIVCRARAGDAAPDLGSTVQRDRGITGECVTTGTVLRCDDTGSDPRVDAAACEQLRIRSLLVAPLRHRGAVVGIVEVFFDRAHAFDDQAVEYLIGVADRIVEYVYRDEVTQSAPAAEKAADLPNAVEEFVPDASQTGIIQEPTPPPSQHDLDDLIADNQPGPVAEEVPSRELMATSAKTNTPPESDSAVGPAPRQRSRAVLVWIIIPAILLIVVFVVAMRKRSPPKLAHSAAPTTQTPVPVEDPVAQMRRAAEAGDAAAQYRLAQAYRSGSGVPADTTEANTWLRRAAENGNADAQFDLAATLEKQPDPDLVESYMWYVIAGLAGNKESDAAIRRLTPKMSPAEIAQVRFRVGQALAEGHALPRDPVAAYTWFALAQWGGYRDAANPMHNLESQLTPRQLADARSRTSAWIRRHTAPTAQAQNPPAQ